jgi:hypothetical protein
MALGYVFWHWTAEAAPSYRERLAVFHRAWIPRGAGFEDWYLVDDFAALGFLNQAAVSGSRREPHDLVARLAVGGTAGVYELKSGRPGEQAETAWWFSKPAGTSYEAFFARLAPLAGDLDVALWRRQMTLGPTPEFCLRSARPVTLPAELAAVMVACRPV